jgi:hypothetical protein
VLYTMGNRNLIPILVADPERVGEFSHKPEGGAVWDTLEGVRMFIAKGKTEKYFTPFGVDADWEADTRPMQGPVSWRELTRRAPLLIIPETGT